MYALTQLPLRNWWWSILLRRNFQSRNMRVFMCVCQIWRLFCFFFLSGEWESNKKRNCLSLFSSHNSKFVFWHDSHLAISWFKGDQCSNRHPEERSDKQTCDLFTIVGCYCSVCVTFYTKHFLFFISKLAVCHNQNCSFFGTRNSDFVNEQLKLLLTPFSHLWIFCSMKTHFIHCNSIKLNILCGESETDVK